MALADLNIRVGADISQMQRKMRDVRRSVYTMTRDIEDVGRSLSRSITLPVMGLATAAVKVSGDFQRSMNRVRAVSGATEKEFEQLNNIARQLGATTEFSASQAADGLGLLAQAGFTAKEAAEAIPGVLQLASAGAVDLADAANIASNILRGYSLETKELSRVNDVLVKTFTETNTDLRMLGESFSYVGPIAAGLGLTIEETAAAIGLMGNAGFQGSTAGTALRGALSRLVNPSEKAAKILRSLGVNATTATGELRPFNEIITMLEQSGASTAQIMEIFGDRAGPAMAALVSQGSEAIRELTEKNIKSAGTAAEIAATQMEGFHGQMAELRSAAEALMISIGEAGLLEQVTKLTKSLSGTLQTLSETNPAILKMATNIGLVAASIGPTLLMFAQLIRAVGTLQKSIVLLNTFTSGWLGGLTAAGSIILPFFIGIRNAVRQINKDMKEGTSALQSNINLGGRGASAYLFAQRTGQDYTPDSPVSEGIVDALDKIGLGYKRATDEIPPYIRASEGAAEGMGKIKTLLDDVSDSFEESAKSAEKAAKAAEEARRKALRAERDAQLKYLVPGTMRIQDVTTERERVSPAGLEKIIEIPETDAAAGAIDRLTESLKEWQSAFIAAKPMEEIFPPEIVFDIAEAFDEVAENMKKAADAGAGLKQLARIAVDSARQIVGAKIREAVMSVVSGTITQNAALGPLAIPIATAAGALAQGAFNSLLNRIRIPHFAKGGITYGPTLGLMGEYRNAASNPEVIAPLDKLRDLIGGNVVNVVVSGRVSGKDLQLVMERNTTSSQRLRGY